MNLLKVPTQLVIVLFVAALLTITACAHASPVDLISQGSSGWDYRIIGGVEHQNLADNFWALNYLSVNWTTTHTGGAAFGNTQGKYSGDCSLVSAWSMAQFTRPLSTIVYPLGFADGLGVEENIHDRRPVTCV